MMIEIQTTPDSDVLNFFPPKPILAAGRAEFADAKSLRKSPLAEHIFDLGGISAVFMTAELISVTKMPDADWNLLKPQIMAEIMDYLSTGEAAVSAPAPQSGDVTAQIRGLLDARIRPAVKRDGGDIKFCKFENGIVFVEMQGSCKGCPYAMVTLKEGVEKVLKTYIPEVREVRNLTPEEA